MTTPRLHHIDALRGLAMVLILPTHALALIGLHSGWDRTEKAIFWTIHAFRLPLFFLVAGFFAALMLQSRGVAGLLRNRIVRIGVPLVVGVALVVPILTLLLRVVSSTPYRSGSDGLIAAVADPQPSYLWFLWYLALLYVIALAARRAVRRHGRFVARMRATSARLLACPPAPLLLALPSAALLYRQPTWLASTPSESFLPSFDLLLYYGVFFAAGWLLFVTPGLRDEIEARPRRYLTYASLALPPALALYLLQGEPAIGQGRWLHLLALVLLSISTWSIVLGLLGLSRRHLSAHNPRLRFWADASYWIYLSHFVPMTALAAVLAAVQMPGAACVALLVLATLGLIYPAYGAFVRHSAIGRVLHAGRGPDQPRRIVQRKTAGVGSGTPAGLIARKRKTWRPGLSRRSRGDLHDRKRRLSSLHSKCEPGRLEKKVNLTRRFVLRFFGCLPMRPFGTFPLADSGAGVAAGFGLTAHSKPPGNCALPTSSGWGSPLPSALPIIATPSTLNAILAPSGE